MYIIKKGQIKEVEVVSAKTGEMTLIDKQSNIYIEKPIDVCMTYSEIKLKGKESEIKKKFRNSKKDKKGKCKCAWCGREGKNLTIDHITSLNSFGGRGIIRRDKEKWKIAWDTKNLQMLCEECNQRKGDFVQEGTLSLDYIDFHARINNNKKKLSKSIHKNSPISKIGYGLATGKWSNNKKELPEYVARADSNILRLDTILKSVEAYDLLPTTL
ncbi:MAG: HNH endonuclease [Sarcina sp.]